MRPTAWFVALKPKLLVAGLLAGFAGRMVVARDCNRNGVEDGADIETGASRDCNSNGVPDECETALGNLGSAAPHDIVFDESARCLAAGDLDGDGGLDLVTVVRNDPDGVEAARILWNRGDGALEAQTDLPTGGHGAMSVTIADMDGGGSLDLLVENLDSRDVSFFVNLGGAAFAPPLIVPTSISRPPFGVLSGGMTVADLNGDGSLDLIVPDYGANQLILRSNTGNADFDPPQSLAMSLGTSPSAVRAADLDGDGSLDLVTANYNADSVSVIVNAGAGAFRPAVQYAVGSFPLSLVLLDLNGDAVPDIATANNSGNGLSVLLGRGDGTFAPDVLSISGVPPLLLAAADLDGDGDPDLAAANNITDCFFPRGSVSLFANLGDGSFLHAATFDAAWSPQGIAAGDLDGDGDADLAWVQLSGGAELPGVVTLYLNRPGQNKLDCDADGVPDACELVANDANLNGVLDACDIAAGTSQDCNADGIPDEAAGDCNQNGAADACDIAGGGSRDANANGVPDECEALPVSDCHGNAEPAGPTLDCNSNRIPDACDLNPPFRLSALETAPLDFAPYWVTSADLDGDTDLDLAVTESGTCCPFYPGSVHILLNDGGGHWYSTGSYGAGANPIFMIARDLDGDGDADLAVANRTLFCREGGSLAVLLNRGNGTFAPARGFAFGSDPRSVAAGDLDGDADVDLAVADGGSPGRGVAIYWNDGQGAFVPGAGKALDSAPESVVAADLDLAVALLAPGSVVLLLNDGRGAFAEGGGFGDAMAPAFLAAGDLDADGDQDLAAGYNTYGEQSLSLFWNSGSGIFPDRDTLFVYVHSGPPLLADLDGDGDLDLARAGGSPNQLTGGEPGFLALAFNQGSRRFAAPLISRAGVFASSLAAGDFDGDGEADLVTANSGSRDLSVLRATGRGTPGVLTNVQTGTGPESIAVADLDGDGDVDLATANSFSEDVAVILNDGGGIFSRLPEIAAGVGPRSLAAGDLDGDGDVDLAVGVRFAVKILQNQGNGKLATGADLPVGSNPVSVVAADLDRDGDVDLATANTLFNDNLLDNASVLINLGDGDFATARNYAVGRHAISVAAADLDGDGDVDLAVANAASGTLSLLSNQGRGRFSPAVHLAMEPDSSLLAVKAADLDADQNIDLVVAVFDGLLVVKNQGQGSFSKPLQIPVSLSSGSFAPADLDGDGDLDLVTRSLDNLTIFRNKGAAEFVLSAAFLFATDQSSLAPVAVDGAGASGDPSNRISALVAPDLDGDGDPDLAMALADRSLLAVVFNSTRKASEDRNLNGIPDECEPVLNAPFRRGDANGDGRFDISDPVRILNFLFLHAEALECRKAADTTDDGRLNLTDAVGLLLHLFQSFGPIPEPFAECGADPTADGLTCASYFPCR